MYFDVHARLSGPSEFVPVDNDNYYLKYTTNVLLGWYS